ncbi:carbohydrate kinase family protein [Thermoflexus hugenholtzii]
MAGPEVLAIGDLVADILVPVPQLPIGPGSVHTLDPIRIEPGGSGNFLITGARLGLRVGALGVLGADELGEMVARALAAEGVDVGLVRRMPGAHTTVVLVLTDGSGRHALIGAFGVSPALPWDPAWEAALQTARVAFLPGYTLAEPALQAIILPWIRRARALGCAVLLDVGPMGVHLPRADLEAVIAAAEGLFGTEEELAAVGLTPEAALAQGPQWVAVKRGAAGCRVVSRAGDFEVPGFPVPVRDTAGAGDSFAAGWVYGLLQGWPLPVVATFANAVGAAKVQKLGTGRQMPTPEEVRQVLARHGPTFSELAAWISPS